MKSENVITILGLVFLCAIGCFLGWGWASNITTIYHAQSIMSGEMVLRVIGIFVFPLGAAMGFM
jgi:hypothetical protein